MPMTPNLSPSKPAAMDEVFFRGFDKPEERFQT
jgi:hypothetical protein